MSIFEDVKEKVLLDQVCDLIDVPLKAVGESLELDDASCPYCGHNDCFRISPSREFGKCFSCDTVCDVISFYQHMKKLPSPVQAARELAVEFNIPLKASSPIQESFNAAANYYHNCLMSAGSQLVLGGVTPLEYQISTRGHSEETILRHSVGWTDGHLYDFFTSVGIQTEGNPLIKSPGRDYFPSQCFIYPHFVRGEVSHFTFKDPTKRLSFQLRKADSLNGVLFYNQDSIKRGMPIYVVEGENDALSLEEAGWEGGVIATIGSISRDQVAAIRDYALTHEVFTVFDNDEAGDKYRLKVKGVTHKRVPEGSKDVDEYLKQRGGTIDGLITQTLLDSPIESTGASPLPLPAVQHNIYETENCLVARKEKGSTTYTQRLSNFTMDLKNVYVFMQTGERKREVVFTHRSGSFSRPVLVSSEAKTSLRAFKTLAAEAIDGTFYGTEQDLVSVWDYVYDKSPIKEVYIPSSVGHVVDKQQKIDGWLFSNVYIENGVVYEADDEGVFWVNGRGLRPQTLTSEGSSDRDIPVLKVGGGDELLDLYVKQLAQNLGGPGPALVTMSWCWANCYSDYFFKARRFFPFLLIWGSTGAGKSHIGRWLSSIFGAHEARVTTVDQMRTGVGFGRKLAYYGSMPVVIDELKQENNIQELYGTMRSWYERVGRSMASSKDSFGVRAQEIKANFMFIGEDAFADAALQSRCIQMKIPRANREMVKSYAAIEGRLEDATSILVEWLTNMIPIEEYVREIDEADAWLVKKGLPARSAKSWSAIYPLMRRLLPKFPGFDMDAYVLKLAEEEVEAVREEGILHRFLNRVRIKAAENPELFRKHICLGGGIIYLDLSYIYKQVTEGYREALGASYPAIRNEIESLSSFLPIPKTIGPNGEERLDKRVAWPDGGPKNRVTTMLSYEDSPLILKDLAEDYMVVSQ